MEPLFAAKLVHHENEAHHRPAVPRAPVIRVQILRRCARVHRACVHCAEVERCTDDAATRLQDRLIDVEDIEVGGTIDEVRHPRCRPSTVEVGGIGGRHCGVVDGAQPRELWWRHRTRDHNKADVVQFPDGTCRQFETGSDDAEPIVHV